MQISLRHTYNVIRTIIVSALVTVVTLYAILYILLSIPAIQQRIKAEGEKELSKFLKTNVKIGELTIKPFNQIVLYDVVIPDQQNGDLIKIDILGAGLNVEKLFSDKRIEINYAELLGLHGNITRANPDSATNLQFIIDAFKPKQKKAPAKFDLAIRNIVVRNTDLHYDVLDRLKIGGRFDANHINVMNLCADIDIPRLRNDDFLIDIKRLLFDEASGLKVKHISSSISITAHQTTVSDLKIVLPHTDLTLNNQTFAYDSIKHIGDAIKKSQLNIYLNNARVNLSDFKPFVPAFAHFTEDFNLTCKILGDKSRLEIPLFRLKDNNGGVSLFFNGTATNICESNKFNFKIPNIKLNIKGQKINKITNYLITLKPNVCKIINNLGDFRLDAALAGNTTFLDFNGKIISDVGDLKLKAQIKRDKNSSEITADFQTPQFNVGKLTSKPQLIGSLAANAHAEAAIINKKLNTFAFIGDIKYIDFKGYRYQNISSDLHGNMHNIKGSLSISDPNGIINATGNVLLNGAKSKYDIDLCAKNVNLSKLRLNIGKYEVVSFDSHTSMTGNSVDNINGVATLNNLTLVDKHGTPLKFNSITLNADNTSFPQVVRFDSDIVTGELYGKFDFSTLIPSFKNLISQVLPNVVEPSKVKKLLTSNNDFKFNLTIEPSDKLHELLNLPIKLLYRATVDGNVNMKNKDISANISIPYIQQGSKLIEGTSITAFYDTLSNAFIANAKTLVPSKNSKVAIGVNAVASNGIIDTDLNWKFNKERDFHGNILTSLSLSKSENKGIAFHANINPSQIVVNDTVWYVNQGAFDYSNSNFVVEGIHAYRDGQFIDIEGSVSKNPEDAIKLELKNIDLDYIFETLHINNVDFGGKATGVFYAKELMSKSPKLLTPNLHVDNLRYNKADMGNADIESHWDNESKGIAINATLSQKNGYKSFVNGTIFPIADSLYIDFNVKKANVRFMKPFMSAFTSDIDGYASGHAVLFGKFKTIDLYGDVYAEDLKLKLDFSNVYYYCTDSVHMSPGLIKFSNVKIKDRAGHSGNLTGWVKHEQFHNASFNFAVTNAKDLLCYDTNAGINPRWYGTIYGSGSAFIEGVPGFVNIKVNMQSAPLSKFTFVMMDNQVANDYKFITYRDRNNLYAPKDTAETKDTVPEIVKLFTKKITLENSSVPTKYLIDLQGDITPDLQINLVMDPVGGDKIKATGRGNLQMRYDNTDEKLEMYGKYALDKGTYNFTLQDIIVKDFTIKDGSTISFQGDPYKALMDIQAIYSLNANIRDLDESFADDRELNRTSVPVHALLKANGVISHPEIGFDLEFPTLTSDAYRKIKSIISTDDMMNRQIIYLLALNRFYTPDYMNGTNRGNEWTSIASSTISSQLSNLLGQINENWTIAPSFRSNKGDFTDTEFDLALSSQLLNNRLRFNGNFGYRDNAYNSRNSNFIGDFDLEYLLNSKGSWLLNAYNHFNDQNLYTRNAMTTQGVGIVFKHDFDNLFDFIHRKKQRRNSRDSVSINRQSSDSLKAKQ